LDIPSEAEGNTLRSLSFGLRGRCPRCGRGGLFEGFLSVADRCPACGLGFGGHDAGDGPAVFGIFILAFGVVGIAGLVEYLLSPPMWLHMLLWTPLIVGGGLLLLRPLKGLTIAIQYRFRSVEEPERPGGT
jgi:uncharacterized protein (DUF983 family)